MYVLPFFIPSGLSDSKINLDNPQKKNRKARPTNIGRSKLSISVNSVITVPIFVPDAVREKADATYGVKNIDINKIKSLYEFFIFMGL